MKEKSKILKGLKRDLGMDDPESESANGMRIAYIAHPISGDKFGNLAKIEKIVRRINMTMKHIVPFVPYYCDCMAMDDDDPRERARGIANGLAIMRSGAVNYLWLYGPEITRGMRGEIAVARKYGIPVVPMTKGTRSDYQRLDEEDES